MLWCNNCLRGSEVVQVYERNNMYETYSVSAAQTIVLSKTAFIRFFLFFFFPADVQLLLLRHLRFYPVRTFLHSLFTSLIDYYHGCQYGWYLIVVVAAAVVLSVYGKFRLEAFYSEEKTITKPCKSKNDKLKKLHSNFIFGGPCHLPSLPLRTACLWKK